MANIMDITTVMATMGIIMVPTTVALAMAVITTMVITMAVTLAKVKVSNMLDIRGMIKMVKYLRGNII
ncbi:MAG: hypothetical protein J6Q22_20040 [Prevotella sp.]|nr:hypothetical protein [Prevotella sp.]